MKRFFTTERLCRAGVIAALYTVLTYVIAPLAFGPIQIRPAEALCILPLFFIEAIPALYIGCMLSNLTSPFFVYDVLLGSLATLLAAIVTYMVGRFFKKSFPKLFLGGLAPVLFNTLIIPLIIVFLMPNGAEGYSSIATAYWMTALSILLSEATVVYGLGTPLYFALQNFKPNKKRNHRK